jgi:hypothetical protein
MHETLGQRLDDPATFFHWINHAALSLAVLKTAIETGLCRHVCDGPLSVEQLAAGCALPVDKVRRLVDYLVCEEVLALSDNGDVRATPQTAQLLDLTSMVLVQARTAEAGPCLTEGLRNGTSAYEARFGEPCFTHLRNEPALAAHFAGFMGYLTTRILTFIASNHVFAPFERAVDIGGSHGELLKFVLAAHPQARGVLFDRPEIAALVEAPLRDSAQGDRIEVVGGDFFEAVPAGDLYLIKMILHDWNDEECVAILRSVRAAIAPGGRVAVIDHLLPEKPRRGSGQFMDIAMMVWATGRERRLSEFETLFAQSGFRLDRVTPNPNGQSVIEAVAG